METKKSELEKMVKEIEKGFSLFPTEVTRNSTVAEAFKVFLRSGEKSIGKSLIKDPADIFFADSKGKLPNPTEGNWAFSRGLEIVKRLGYIVATPGTAGVVYSTALGIASVKLIDGEVTPEEIIALIARKAKKVKAPSPKRVKKTA